MPDAFSHALALVSVAWILFEVALVVLRRAAASHARDAGTLRMLNVAIYGSVAAGVTLAMSGVGRVELPPAVRWGGLGLIVLGLAIRGVAIAVLGRAFTVDVAIRPGQQIVEAGPYRLIRHPSYTGAILSFAGLALAGASWVGAGVMLVPIALAFRRRMAVEEAALREAFPEVYPGYVARTWRLVPWIY